MMSSKKMSFLLDTNHCVYYNNARNKRPEAHTDFEKNMLAIFNSTTDPLFTSEVTLGEMYFGASKSPIDILPVLKNRDSLARR